LQITAFLLKAEQKE